MKQFIITFTYKLFFFVALLFFVGILSSQTKAYAAGAVNVDWGVPDNSPVFNFTNMAPGQSISKAITVTNTTGSGVAVGIQGVLTNQTDNISDVIHITIVNGSTTLYGDNNAKTLTQFFTDSANGQFIPLTQLQNNGSTTYTVTATFDQTAGNQYQGANIVFSLAIGSDMTSVSLTPTGTITPTLTPTPTIAGPTPTHGPHPREPHRRPFTLQQILEAIFREQQALFRLIFTNSFPFRF